jgi:hypothetical protein
MKLRTLVVAISAVAGLSMAPAAFSQTCSTAAWGQGGNPNVNPVVGSPVAGQPGSVSRYEGRCGLRAPTNGGNYVQDSSPAAEPTFRARFYAFLPNTGSASTIFRAGNATADSALTTFTDGRIRVEWNGSNSIIARGPGGTPTLTCSGLTAGRWYSVELAYNSTGAALGTGADTLAANSLRVNVRNESLTPAINCTQTNSGIATSANNTIDYVQIGNLTGGPAGNAITVDSYESRRTTPIGRLCRGDANGDGNRNTGDITAIRLEFLNSGVPVGQTAQAGSKPDCNEDGSVNSGDITCVRLIFLGGAGVCPAAN